MRRRSASDSSKYFCFSSADWRFLMRSTTCEPALNASIKSLISLRNAIAIPQAAEKFGWVHFLIAEFVLSGIEFRGRIIDLAALLRIHLRLFHVLLIVVGRNALLYRVIDRRVLASRRLVERCLLLLRIVHHALAHLAQALSRATPIASIRYIADERLRIVGLLEVRQGIHIGRISRDVGRIGVIARIISCFTSSYAARRFALAPADAHLAGDADAFGTVPCTPAIFGSVIEREVDTLLPILRIGRVDTSLSDHLIAETWPITFRRDVQLERTIGALAAVTEISLGLPRAFLQSFRPCHGDSRIGIDPAFGGGAPDVGFHIRNVRQRHYSAPG